MGRLVFWLPVALPPAVSSISRFPDAVVLALVPVVLVPVPIAPALAAISRSLCDRGRDTSGPGTPRTDPDGRSLAHPVLISDEWRQSEHRGKDWSTAGWGSQRFARVSIRVQL